MAREAVVFKGTRHGITIQIDDEAEFRTSIDGAEGKVGAREGLFPGGLGQAVCRSTQSGCGGTGGFDGSREGAWDYLDHHRR